LGGVASVALGLPGTGVIVLVGFGEAGPPSAFIVVGWAAARGFLGVVESPDEIMGEQDSVEGGWVMFC
jgi:hypothetical protein